MSRNLRRLLDPDLPAGEAQEILQAHGLADPAGALQNLRRLAQILSRRDHAWLLPRLLTRLQEAPDPDLALNQLETAVRASEKPGALLRILRAEPDILETLVTLLGSSQSLARTVCSDPESVVAWLRTPGLLDRPQSAASLRASFRKAVRPCDTMDALMATLREVRHREMLRIGLRDLLGRATLVETTEELSNLADAALDAALAWILAEMEGLYGTPRFRDSHGRLQPTRFTVLGMGKLGGRELNFSSDIDLMFLYTSERGETSGGTAGSLPSHPFFAKVAERLIRVIAANTPEGFVFRVDTRLRPEGEKGDLVASLRSYEIYYESWGKTWERAALIKVRPVAGDAAMGKAFLEMIRPFVYRKYLDYGALAEVRDMKTRMDQHLRVRAGRGMDVKLGRGGIREVEFITQAFQLIYGGREPALRERNTLKALHKLSQKGFISYDEYASLTRAYAFLRNLEHRIQILEERQLHTLPGDPVGLQALARRMGYRERGGRTPAEGLLGDFSDHTEAVRRVYDNLFSQPVENGIAPPSERYQVLLHGDLPEEESFALLSRMGLRDPRKALRNLRVLTEGATFSQFTPRSRRIVLQALPAILNEIIGSPDPDLALNHWEGFVSAMGAQDTFYKVLSEHPGAVRLLVALFSHSAYLSQLLITRPELADVFLLEEDIARPKPRHRLLRELAEAVDANPALGQKLDALRRFKSQEEIRIGMRDVVGEASFIRTAVDFTCLAEACLEKALDICTAELAPRYGIPRDPGGEPATLAILGVGKLGGRELTYSSDLDVLYVYSEDGESDGLERVSNHVYFAKLAEKVTSALGALTREGIAFRMDTRLRPTGTKGPLAQSLAACKHYYTQEAETWEHQALIKVRPVGGEPTLGKAFLDLAHRVVYRDPPDPDLAQKIRTMRRRMEAEIGGETPEALNIKTGPGGLVDVEFAVQFKQLVHGGRHPTLRVPGTLSALKRLGRLGLMAPEHRKILLDAYLFFRLLESRLRIVNNISSSLLPMSGERLETLARRLGYKSGEELLKHYRRHAGRVREVFEGVVNG